MRARAVLAVRDGRKSYFLNDHDFDASWRFESLERHSSQYRVAAGSDYICAVRTDSTLWCWGGNSYGELGIDPAPTNRYCSR